MNFPSLGHGFDPRSPLHAQILPNTGDYRNIDGFFRAIGHSHDAAILGLKLPNSGTKVAREVARLTSLLDCAPMADEEIVRQLLQITQRMEAMLNVVVADHAALKLYVVSHGGFDRDLFERVQATVSIAREQLRPGEPFPTLELLLQMLRADPGARQ